jgi:hypothetical protein
VSGASLAATTGRRAAAPRPPGDRSRAIGANGGTGLWLSYWDWFEVEDAVLSDLYDRREVWVSNDEFQTWTSYPNQQLASEEGTWRQRVLDLSGFPAGLLQVRFGFDTGDEVANQGRGWFIDRLLIRADEPPEVCTDVVDNDGDGEEDCADPECQGTPALPAVTTTDRQAAGARSLGSRYRLRELNPGWLR